MEHPFLRINGVSFSYKRKTRVFQDFSLDFRPGEIVGLLGKNGTGKSTLLYLITGLLRPDQGEVCLKGLNVSKRLPQTLLDVFLVPEVIALPDLSMKQFVRIHAPFYPKFSEELLQACLRDFDLDLDIRLKELSMGQQKKAYICFALAANTSLLLMDEPTNGLDIPAKSQFRKVVSSGMTDEKAILISTHQVRDVDRLLDHIVIIDGNDVLLNHSVNAITRKLQFIEQDIAKPLEGALYVQPSVYGNSVIFPNAGEDDSTLNIELLFNAVLAERDKMKQMFNQEEERI